ncbi:hypothetical protein DFH09DRAFT_151710 [Mycena vulgaris]|nr:hypothetical protein DFH09DRAFT_151710 [Mycena vulgaris]
MVHGLTYLSRVAAASAYKSACCNPFQRHPPSPDLTHSNPTLSYRFPFLQVQHMHLKSLLLPVLLASVSVQGASVTTAWTTFPEGRDLGANVGIGGRTLVARTSGTGTTLTGTPTATTPKATQTTDQSGCNWCECLTALAAEGLACAAAILEGGCNIVADISCIIDATAFGQAVPKCLACLH